MALGPTNPGWRCHAGHRPAHNSDLNRSEVAHQNFHYVERFLVLTCQIFCVQVFELPLDLPKQFVQSAPEASEQCLMQDGLLLRMGNEFLVCSISCCCSWLQVFPSTGHPTSGMKWTVSLSLATGISTLVWTGLRRTPSALGVCQLACRKLDTHTHTHTHTSTIIPLDSNHHI